jgi:hypothetical protein
VKWFVFFSGQSVKSAKLLIYIFEFFVNLFVSAFVGSWLLSNVEARRRLLHVIWQLQVQDVPRDALAEPQLRVPRQRRPGALLLLHRGTVAPSMRLLSLHNHLILSHFLHETVHNLKLWFGCISNLHPVVSVFLLQLCSHTLGWGNQFVGVWLTMRYRNQKDPRANAAAFL